MGTNEQTAVTFLLGHTLISTKSRFLAVITNERGQSSAPTAPGKQSLFQSVLAPLAAKARAVDCACAANSRADEAYPPG